MQKGYDSAAKQASGALGDGAGVRSSMGTHGGGGHPGVLPFGDKGIDFSLVSLDSAVRTGSLDQNFQAMNQGGGAIGSGPVEAVTKVTDHMVAAEAKGDQVSLDNLNAHEGFKAPPTLQGDAQLRQVGMIGGEGAQH